MSYILKSKDSTFLISISNVGEDEYIILASNLKQFFVQKNITSEMIQKKFNDSDTNIKLSLKKIIKIIQEEQPEKDSEITINGSTLALVLKFPIKVNNLRDTFSIDFNLMECKSPSEIGELFLSGLLKTIIDQKIKSEKLCISLPQKVPFEANFSVDITNISDFCGMIGANEQYDEIIDDKLKQGESSNLDNNITKDTRHGSKRQIVTEFKFENLEESQEMEDDKPMIMSKRQPATILSKHSKKKNLKF